MGTIRSPACHPGRRRIRGKSSSVFRLYVFLVPTGGDADQVAFAFLIAQFGINIAGNAISGGIDLASMFPKYINLKRGAYIVSGEFYDFEIFGFFLLISDHRDGSTNVSMGSAVRCDRVHKRDGRICDLSGAHLRPDGLRLHPGEEGTNQIELFGMLVIFSFSFFLSFLAVSLLPFHGSSPKPIHLAD